MALSVSDYMISGLGGSPPTCNTTMKRLLPTLLLFLNGYSMLGCSHVKCSPKLEILGHSWADYNTYAASSEEKCKLFVQGFHVQESGTLHLYFKWKSPEQISGAYIKIYPMNRKAVYEKFFTGTPSVEMYFSIHLESYIYYIDIGSKKGHSAVISFFWAELDQYREYTELIRAALKAALHSPPIHALKEGARLLRFSAQPVQPAAAYLNQESQKCEQKKPPLHRAVEEQEPCESRELRHETRRICWRFLSAIT